MFWGVVVWVLAVSALNCSMEYNPHVKMQLQLSGKHFEIPFNVESPWSMRSPSGSYSGYSVNVLSYVAQRGNFTFRIVDGASPLTPNETDIQVLQRLIADENVNMFGSYWTDTADRRAKGGLFSLQYLDATRILVTFPDQLLLPSVGEVMFTFLKPFRWDTWLAIIAGCILSALMTYWFELSRLSGQTKRYKKALEEAKGVRWKTVFPFMVRSFGHFSASGDVLEARTVAGRLHNVVWAFLVLILLAAYLANLASFLVIQTQKAPSYQDINAVLAAKATVCVDPEDSVARFYTSAYPNLKQYPPIDYEVSEWAPNGNKPQALVDAMRDGFCVGIIMARSTVDVLQKDSANCDLTKRDAVSAPFGAGFGFPMERCGPFLLAVVDSILVDMQTDGTLNALWVTLVPPGLCPPASTFFAVASAEALSVDSFAGLFFLYLAFVFAAILLRIFRKLCIRAERKLISRLSKSQKEMSMSEFAETSVNVSPSGKTGDLVSLDEKVTRMDRAMAEILSSVIRLAEQKPADNNNNNTDPTTTTPTSEPVTTDSPTPRAASSTLSEALPTPRVAASTLS